MERRSIFLTRKNNFKHVISFFERLSCNFWWWTFTAAVAVFLSLLWGNLNWNFLFFEGSFWNKKLFKKIHFKSQLQIFPYTQAFNNFQMCSFQLPSHLKIELSIIFFAHSLLLPSLLMAAFQLLRVSIAAHT